MKTIITAAIVLMLLATAHSGPLDNVVSSALMEGDSVTFDLDFIDPFGLPVFDVTVEARVSTFNETYSIPMQHIDYPPYYINTYEGGWIFEEPTSVIEFYGRVEAETLLITQSYRNTGNQFPPDMDLYADLADEPDGDTQPDNPGPFTDLTGSGITYSDDRLFVNLRNDGGGWPTDNGGLDFYIYAFALYNPDNPNLTGTALVYGGIPFVLDPGLFTVDLQDSTFERIADIDYQIQGTTLHMSCTIEDLLSDPGWTVWPPESGFILTGGLTLTISLFTPSLNDYTYPAGFVPQTSFLDLFENWPPDIEGSVNPVPEDYVEATVIYSDQDNNLPVEKTFYFDDTPHDMGTYDRDYFDEAMFEYRVDWPMEGGWHTYYFRFSDGVEVVETELDSVYLSPIGTDDEPVPSQFTLEQNYPNPFNAQTSIQFNLPESGLTQLAIYDITGNSISVLLNDYLESGHHTVVWDGRNSSGQPVSSGVYFYRISVGDHTATRRMLLLK
jgi:hypothetical protein